MRGTADGICALICPADTKRSGASVPFTVTETSARVSGSGIAGALAVTGARPEPKTENSDPGESAVAEKLAALTTA